ncbi:hypothetical protein NLI96_g6147 [Meripilus lineatus]|uniref:Uncharacterized protein n=1 Tax=Meripilus lineatus TaxID=2056292 RepID=A0AAD5YIB7_9APHY|nr:hypothetical protein NLI96_g6147 [Physisporinus lineatus]
MTSSQALFVATSTALPAYSFLSHPPQKQVPSQPLPEPPAYTPFPAETGRNRSATFANITAWIENVQPGTPTPATPRQRSSSNSSIHVSTGRSHSRHRDHTSTHKFGRVTAAITPTSAGFEPDLKAIGYGSAFFNFQNIVLPLPIPERKTKKRTAQPQPEDEPSGASKGVKRFRSLSAIRPGRHARSNSTTQQAIPLPLPIPVMPLSAKSFTKSSESKPSKGKSSSGKSKKSHYVKSRPPPLANELALAQFIDGGSLEDHIRSYNQERAKAAGTAKTPNGQRVVVDDVWRDGQGGIWRDQGEQLEYEHLLDDDLPDPVEVEWIPFGPHPDEGKLRALPDWTRGSYSSQGSDLDPRHAIQPADDTYTVGNILTPRNVGMKEGTSFLDISPESAKHVRKPDFVLDMFPAPPSSSCTTSSHRSPLTPRADSFNNQATHGHARPTGKARRRPPPLTLAPPKSGHTVALNPSDPEEVRKDFLDASFHPPAALVVVSPLPARTPKTSTHTRKALKTPMLNVRSFLKVMGRKLN